MEVPAVKRVGVLTYVLRAHPPVRGPDVSWRAERGNPGLGIEIASLRSQ